MEQHFLSKETYCGFQDQNISIHGFPGHLDLILMLLPACFTCWATKTLSMDFLASDFILHVVYIYIEHDAKSQATGISWEILYQMSVISSSIKRYTRTAYSIAWDFYVQLYMTVVLSWRGMKIGCDKVKVHRTCCPMWIVCSAHCTLQWQHIYMIQ